MDKTNIYEFQEAKSIVVAGDIHGDYSGIVFKTCISKRLTDTLIVVAGDCGFGFQKPGYFENMYRKCVGRLDKANNWLLFVRGNHDNPAYFDGQQVNYERWKAVPDYSVIKACGHAILCVGGAITMERTWREASEYHHFHSEDPFLPDLYWPGEKPVYDADKLDAIDKVCTIDTVVTHTAPSFCEPKEKRSLADWTAEDPLLPTDVTKERKVMDDIHTYLKEHDHPVGHWFYGHFHQSWHSEIDGMKFNMLDVMQVHQVDCEETFVDKEYEKRMERLAKAASKIPVF